MNTEQTTQNISATTAHLLEIEERIYEVLDEIRQDNQIQSKQMLGVAEVARLTGYTEDYVRKLVQNRVLPHYKPNAKKIFFDKEEIIDWLKRTRVEAQDTHDVEGILDNYINN